MGTEALGVGAGSGIDGLELVLGEGLELDLQDGGLEGVEAGVHADAHIVVFVGAFAVDTVGLDEGGPLVVVGEDGTAVAVAAERLGGEEGGGGDIAEAASYLVADTATEALGAVFEHIEAVIMGDAAYLGVGGGKTEEVDSDDYTGGEAAFGLDFLNLSLKVGGGDVEGGLFDVDKDGGGSFEGYNLGGGEEGEVGHEHGIAGADAPGFQSEGEGVGAVGAGEAVFYAYVLCEFFF